MPHQDTRLLLVPLILPDAWLLLGLRLSVAMGEEFDPPFRVSQLLETLGFGCQCSPPRRWFRQANRCLSQSLEVLLSTPLLRTAWAFYITLILPAENCTV